MTQSSMHFPPLRHGRRARHTEAADTGGAEQSSLHPPTPKGSISKEWLCRPLAAKRPGFFFPGLRKGAQCPRRLSSACVSLDVVS